jgi:hypothetical protein
MLNSDELHDGVKFVLQLRNSADISSQWMETLRGDVASRWYAIYATSDWTALRNEAAGVFRNSITETQMREFLEHGPRCVFIHTPPVKVEELRPSPEIAGLAGSPAAQQVAPHA